MVRPDRFWDGWLVDVVADSLSLSWATAAMKPGEVDLPSGGVEQIATAEQGEMLRQIETEALDERRG